MLEAEDEVAGARAGVEVVPTRARVWEPAPKPIARRPLEQAAEREALAAMVS